MYIVRHSLLAILVVLVAGCARSNRTEYFSPQVLSIQRTAAVLPLVNLTPQPQAGRIAGDILAGELYGVQGLRFVERTAMQQALRAGEDDLEHVMDVSAAQTLGRKLGVQAVIYGSVTEFAYRRGLDQNPVVGLTVRMLDVESGTVLWAATVSRTGTAPFPGGDSLNMTMQEACAEVVKGLAIRTARQGG